MLLIANSIQNVIAYPVLEVSVGSATNSTIFSGQPVEELDSTLVRSVPCRSIQRFNNLSNLNILLSSMIISIQNVVVKYTSIRIDSILEQHILQSSLAPLIRSRRNNSSCEISTGTRSLYEGVACLDITVVHLVPIAVCIQCTS